MYFCPLYYIVVVIVDGQFLLHMHYKYIYNCKKDEEVVRLLRSYAKQIFISAMKKIGAPLLGLTKYIYITVYTDDNPLTYVLTSTMLNATGHRWVVDLSDFNFTI